MPGLLTLRNLGLSLLFFCSVVVLSASTAFAVCTQNTNLIVNGDAETDQGATGDNSDIDVSGWEPETGGFTVVRYNTAGGFPTTGGPGPLNRGNFFFTGGHASSSSGTQTIDLSDCAPVIDAGAMGFDLGAYLGGYQTDGDNAQFTINFKDAGNATIGTTTLGPVLPADRGNVTGLLSRTAAGKVPVGTRSVEAVLSMNRSVPNDNDGYADNLSFVMLPSVGEGEIIYSRLPASSGVDGTIWGINASGTGDHQITTGSRPRVSPNSTYMIFKRKFANSTDPNYNYGLFIRNLSTGAENQIFYQGDYIVGFDFNSDGSKIVFDWGCVIYVMNLDGSNVIQIDGNCYDDAPTSRKSDGMLAFHYYGGLLTSDAYGGNRLQVPNTAAGDYNPSWSADGQYLAYVQTDGSSSYPYFGVNLYKIKPDGTGKTLLKNLTGTDRFGQTGGWSNDGTTINMPATIGGVSGIYRIATDGSGTVSFSPMSQSLIASGAIPEFASTIFAPLAPTAASVSVSGRVFANPGQGLRNATVVLSDQSGRTRQAVTSSFGYFQFEDVEVGKTYFLNVSSKLYRFPSQVVTVNDSVAAIEFVPDQNSKTR